MFKAALVAIVTLSSFTCFAQSPKVPTPFTLSVGVEPGNNVTDTIIQLENHDQTLRVNDIIVDHHQCIPLTKIPANYIVPKDMGFVLRFKPKSGKVCHAESIIVKTNLGDFEF